MKKYTILIVLFVVTVFPQVSIADVKDRGRIASHLFDINNSSIDHATDGANYNYNNWQAIPNTNNACDGYRGGHSGIDMQTKDVAGTATAQRTFYSVSKGIVITAGGDDFNTIAVYDKDRNITVIYLHAETVSAAIDDIITVGDALGVQGSTGAGTAEHVHLEVRSGERTGSACGASTTIDPEINILKYLNINIVPITFLLLDDDNNCQEGASYVFNVSWSSNAEINIDVHVTEPDGTYLWLNEDGPTVELDGVFLGLSGNITATVSSAVSGEYRFEIDVYGGIPPATSVTANVVLSGDCGNKSFVEMFSSEEMREVLKVEVGGTQTSQDPSNIEQVVKNGNTESITNH